MPSLCRNHRPRPIPHLRMRVHRRVLHNKRRRLHHMPNKPLLPNRNHHSMPKQRLSPSTVIIPDRLQMRPGVLRHRRSSVPAMRYRPLLHRKHTHPALYRKRPNNRTIRSSTERVPLQRRVLRLTRRHMHNVYPRPLLHRAHRANIDPRTMPNRLRITASVHPNHRLPL